MRRWPLAPYAIVTGTGANLVAYVVAGPIDSGIRLAAYLVLTFTLAGIAGCAWRGEQG